MKSIKELMHTKAQLEEALEMVNTALQSEEYSKPFSFQLSNPLKPEEFNHDLIKQILDRCTSREIGFDPNLMLQHIESEVLDQFNEIVKTAIKGKSIRNLMEVRHELELFMLTDRKKQHEHNLKAVEADLKKIQDELDRADLEEEKANRVATIDGGLENSVHADAPVLKDESIDTLKAVATKKKKG